ncbi:3-hydroxybutyrate dehydrogenase [Sphingomicrobium astaxanthinifaciens]|uniref:3-hydroxybutyrate dehydrogenase n=1 Tax=Sphingomicrobium astaxanthinifaciens TaxID=1227949 RepID=UPI001FCB423C|nr:3-hydroxybutyrate dehydrogenase [Sphingomicrobium astaxanthinifaciens]MCJ7420724.1 3-hydroxybutyrate dehydrogenase [Sphingomicrobium astaxanthinifaciens]
MTDLTGKRALVTGSTSGIGLAIARGFADAGASVMINGFGPEHEVDAILADLRKRSGAEAVHSDADLTDPEAIASMVADCVSAIGSPHLLVNNAGMQHVAPIAEFPVDKWDKIIALNLSAVFHSCRLVIPMMRKAGFGRIINTASAHSLVASPNKSAYVAAKHAVAGFTKTIALETAEEGITANCISPGYVWTPLVEQQIPDTMAARGLSREEVMNEVLLKAQPTRRFVTVEEVASCALFLCSDGAASITGANISMDGGWTAQ